jgi:hypothetical protein
MDIVRWRPSNFSLLKRDESSLHSKTFPLSPYFSFWHVNNTSWIICGSAYYLLTYEISHLPHRFTCCYRQTARLSHCVLTFNKHISLTNVASCLRSNYTESKDVKKTRCGRTLKKTRCGRSPTNMFLLVTATDVTPSNDQNYNTNPAIFSFIRNNKHSNVQVNLHAF